MGLKKLKIMYILIAGAVLSIGIGFGIFQYCIKPTKDSIEALDKRYDAANAIAITKPSVQAQLDKAIADNNMTMGKFNGYVKKLMFPISFEDRANGMIALWKHQLEVEGPFIQKWITRLDSKNGKGASLSLPFSIKAPPVDPNSALFAAQMWSLPLGSATAVGSFSSICAQVRAWNKCPRLAQVDGLTLDGSGDKLVGKYNVTLYFFPQGTAGANVSMAGGAAAGAGATAAAGAAKPGPVAAAPAASAGGGAKGAGASTSGAKGGGLKSKASAEVDD